MEFISWDESMSVGVESLDKDHMRLLELFNELLSSGIVSRSKDDLRKLLAELAEYTHVHFSREERCMADCGYPGLSTHKEAHRYFVDEVERQRAEFDESDAVMLRIDLLKEWLLEHIQGTDKKYGPFMVAAH
ncbi:hemerythrin family protein [bacterium]|nr:hemerythrin family protein [bacterium]